jgi:hypothetical protein
MNLKLQNKSSFRPGLNVYCDTLLTQSVPCVSHNARREAGIEYGSVNEHEAQSATIPFVGIIIRKEYELRQQSHFIFLVDVLRHRKKPDFSWRQNVLLIVSASAGTK